MATAETAQGTTKIGRSISHFSTTPGASCPGASAWCLANCYAERFAKRWPDHVALRWAENLEAVQANTMPEIPAKAKAFRIHVAGDFFSPEYIAAWIMLVRSRPDVKFWAYTRSWRVAKLLPMLERLRNEKNMQLFASTDWTIEEAPPEGWRVAMLKGDDRTQGFQCPEQTGAKKDCASCGYCFKGFKGNVKFKVH